MLDFEKLVLSSRSIRNFKDKTIDTDILKKLINITRFCPSSANLQSLKYIIVNNPIFCQKVFDNIKFAGYLPNGTVPKPNCESRAYIIICNDNKISKNPLLIDAGIVAQTIMLYANSLGISGCMVGSFSEKNIKSALNIKDDYDTALVLALGYKNEDVEITDVNNNDIKYYRDNNIHYIPKRELGDIIIDVFD